MERKLASIQVIDDLQPIEGADMIEVATVNAWKIVVKKDEFKVGDKCVYCEIDCLMPDRPEFEFLKPRGMRVRTIKLRGQISQGLCFPVNILPDNLHNDMAISGVFWDDMIGVNVTEDLGIIKYEPSIPASLAGKVKGNFPSFIPKTDEERIQNLSKYYDGFKSNIFYVTEKLDGSSATFYMKDGIFGVCSRNMDLLESEENSFWKAARKIELEYKLRFLNIDNIAFQGELIGEGIQGNPYKLVGGQQVKFFNIWDIDTQQYYNYAEFISMLHTLGYESVPVLADNYKLPDTIEELLKVADDKSKLNGQADREGIVVRSLDRHISFKVISNKFLLKEK